MNQASRNFKKHKIQKVPYPEYTNKLLETKQMLALHSPCLDLLREPQPGFTNPTGPVKPPPSGSGLPDRFDRKPVKTG